MHPTKTNYAVLYNMSVFSSGNPQQRCCPLCLECRNVVEEWEDPSHFERMLDHPASYSHFVWRKRKTSLFSSSSDRVVMAFPGGGGGGNNTASSSSRHESFLLFLLTFLSLFLPPSSSVSGYNCKTLRKKWRRMGKRRIWEVVEKGLTERLKRRGRKRRWRDAGGVFHVLSFHLLLNLLAKGASRQVATLE